MRVKIISILPEELASAQSRGSIRGSIQRTPVHDGERRLIVIDPELSVLLRWVAISHAATPCLDGLSPLQSGMP